MLVVLASVSACSGDAPSKSEAERLIRQYRLFQVPKTARIPRRIVLASGYGNARPSLHLKAEDWQYVDWVTYSLSGARYLNIVDNARPMSFGMNMSMPRYEDPSDEDYQRPSHEDSYEHYIDVRLTPEGEQSGDFVEDDDDPEPGMYNMPPSRTPGWKLIVARRKLEGVAEILDKSASKETVLPGNAVAYFDFKWVPTPTGALFDQGSDAFTHLSLQSGASARQMMRLDSRLPMRAKVFFNRVEKGHWIIKGMECGRCGYFDEHP